MNYVPNLVNTLGLSGIPRMNSIEVNEMFKKIKAGSEEARKRLCINYIYIVDILTAKYLNCPYFYDEVTGVGCLALLKAIDSFDLSQGVRFPSYATPKIRGEIKNYFRDHYYLVKISRKFKDLATEINYRQAEAEKQINKALTLKELSAVLNVSESDIIEALKATQFPISLDQGIMTEEDEAIDKYNIISDSNELEGIEDNEERKALYDAINRLSPELKNIVEERFFNNKSQREIAVILGVSQMYISRKERLAIGEIRKTMAPDLEKSKKIKH